MTDGRSGIPFRIDLAKVCPSRPTSRIANLCRAAFGIGLEFFRAVYSGRPADAWHERLPEPKGFTGQAVSMENTLSHPSFTIGQTSVVGRSSRSVTSFYQIKMEVSK